MFSLGIGEEAAILAIDWPRSDAGQSNTGQQHYLKLSHGQQRGQAVIRLTCGGGYRLAVKPLDCTMLASLRPQSSIHRLGALFRSRWSPQRLQEEARPRRR